MEKHMNDLLDAVKDETGMAKKDIERAIRAAEAAIIGMLEAGDSLTLYEFGKFEMKKKPERLAFSVTECRKIIIPAHSVPVFKFARGVKDKLNKQ